VVLERFSFPQPLLVGRGESREVRTVVLEPQPGSGLCEVRVASRGARDGSPWTTHATAWLLRGAEGSALLPTAPPPPPQEEAARQDVEQLHQVRGSADRLLILRQLSATKPRPF